MNENHTVSVVIVTYNQEKFIAAAIESALAQQTTFNYVIVISDDCSDDSTSVICSGYAHNFPEKIRYNRNKENRGLVLNYKAAFDLCNSKYIAILEGDDFWNYKYKLQEQVDIMEKNSEIGLVHTDCKRIVETEENVYKIQKSSRRKIFNGKVFTKIIYKNFIVSITACFRSELLKKYISLDDYAQNKAATIDYSLWTELSFYTEFFYLNKITATYRIHKNSISNADSFFKREDYFNRGRRLKKYIISKYNPLKPTPTEIDAIYDWGLCKLAIKMKNHDGFRKYIQPLKNKKLKYFVLYHITKSDKLFYLMLSLYR